MQTPLQQVVGLLGLHGLPDPLQFPTDALALFASPKQASAIPARPTPNFFSDCRRVVDWANPLASSSNLSFTLFLSVTGSKDRFLNTFLAIGHQCPGRAGGTTLHDWHAG